LTKGGFANFIITEAVPLLGHLNWNNTHEYADSFYQFAQAYNPNIQYYLFETWHCIHSGTGTGCPWDEEDSIQWRPRLDYDLPKWEGIAQYVTNKHSTPMLIIPGGQGLALLYDSINAGKLSGISHIQQLFSDDIHLNNIGNYFIACIMYSVLHAQSPLGLPNQLTDSYGVPYSQFPSNTQAATLQNTAWQIVCNYNKDGVSCNPTVINENINIDEPIVYPNPSSGKIKINSEYSSVEILNQLGQTIAIFRNNEPIIIPKKGIYFCRILDAQQIYYKKIVITDL
jgi:hypothetical protein